MNSFRTFTCDLCRKPFKDKYSMIAHRKFHRGKKIFECDICKKKCSLKADLVKHKRSHTGEKPFECDICEKTFTQKGSLVNHKRIHTGEKPFVCMLCLKSFPYSASLSLHYKSDIHLEKMKSNNLYSFSDKNLVIDCGKSIKLEDVKEEKDEVGRGVDPLSILQMPESIYKNSYTSNTSLKEYSCDICEKLFFDKSMLDIHQYIHVNDNRVDKEKNTESEIKEEIKEEVIDIKEEVLEKDPLFV